MNIHPSLKPMEKLVRQSYLAKNETDNLVLYNYTDKATYERYWNVITTTHRGKVYEKATGKVVARPFNKFFNYGELPTRLRNILYKQDDYTCYEKIDGSLGIVYHYGNDWRVNTRGSFNSDQAIEAKSMLDELYSPDGVNTDYTLLCEIIYPENRIAIDYGDRRELILLAIYNRIEGNELSRRACEEIAQKIGMKIVPEIDITYPEMFQIQENKRQLDTEGFVVRHANGLRVKIKTQLYFDISRTIAQISPLVFWRNMKMGKVEDDFLMTIPEEIHIHMGDKINKIRSILESAYRSLRNEIYGEYESVMENDPTRKEIGLTDGLKHKNCLFYILDGKTEYVDEYILRRIRPTGNDLDAIKVSES